MILTKDAALVVPKKERNGQLLFGRHDKPIAPAEISQEVELYARESGRHATIAWIPFWNCWVVRMTRVSHDPLLGAIRDGRLPEEEQYEMIPLQVWDAEKRKMVSLDIDDMGASGVRQFLEKGNTWSGRGQFKSLEEGVRKTREQRIATQERQKQQAIRNARYRALDHRRQVLGIPYLPVGIDIKEK